MATQATFSAQAAGDPFEGAAMQHRPWRSRASLSSVAHVIERFLGTAGFDRAPWVAVALAAGIGLWFALDNRGEWLACAALFLGLAAASAAVLRAEGSHPYLRQALVVVPGALTLGLLLIWAKSEMVGARPIPHPLAATLAATIVDREQQPAQKRVRLVLATREPGGDRAIKVRVNLPAERDLPGLTVGAKVRLRARLMPPSPPMLPGGYDFARASWFTGLSAVGNVVGAVTILAPGPDARGLSVLQARLSDHVRAQLDGSSGAIAAAFASGDRGAITEADDQAMRDSGLAHLLSISGLHVSAVVAAGYFLALRLLALWGWLALRVRLPLLAAGAGALAGISYTLLSGAEVPTVRSCIGAVLVLLALALGREPLSMRMIAVAAVALLLLWPEAVIGPSFQMSFAAVIAIVALHGAAPIRAFLAPREEPWWARLLRQLAMLLLTGVAIELALMPIGLFHFHRAGVYGALANVVAIPLTTIVSMPLIAAALLLDLVNAGAPVWWLAGLSIDLMLALAHRIADMPGAVTALPANGAAGALVAVAGALWLALWRGRVRLVGLLPIVIGGLILVSARPPDILVTGDGRHVGLMQDGELYLLREASGFSGDNIAETAGLNGLPRELTQWPGARCSRDFCAINFTRSARTWRLLLALGRDPVSERALAAACARADLVIADRWLPRSCRPVVLKIDKRLLAQTGGLTISLDDRRVRTVGQEQGMHGWWRPGAGFAARTRRTPAAPAGAPTIGPSSSQPISPATTATSLAGQ